MATDRDDEDDTDRRPTAAEMARHRRVIPPGPPAVEPAEHPEYLEVDWPIAPDRIDAEVLRRGGRDPDDPVRPAEVSAIVRQLAARLRDEFSRLLTDAPQDALKRLDALERDFDPVRRLGRWAAGIALGAALAIGAFLYRRGADEQRAADEMKAVREKAERCETKIDQLLNLKESRP